MNNKDITQLKKSILYFNNIDKEINESKEKSWLYGNY